MRIWLNDFLLNDPANRAYLDEPIEGLDLPGIRTSRGVRAGQPGSYFGAQLFDARFIALTGRIWSQDVYEAKRKRREIQEAMPLYPENIVVRVEDDDGFTYRFRAQLIDFKMPIGRNSKVSRFKLDLEAPDPTIYDDTAGSLLQGQITKPLAGGLLFSDDSPTFSDNFYFTASKGDLVVQNVGTVDVYPIIVLTGSVTDPVFTNRTTGERFSLAGYGVGEDSVTQIDMQTKTIRLGTVADLQDGFLPDGVGANVFGYVPLTAAWWPLVPGSNEIIYESAGGSDVREAVMYWRPGLRGI